MAVESSMIGVGQIGADGYTCVLGYDGLGSSEYFIKGEKAMQQILVGRIKGGKGLTMGGLGQNS